MPAATVHCAQFYQQLSNAGLGRVLRPTFLSIWTVMSLCKKKGGDCCKMLCSGPAFIGHIAVKETEEVKLQPIPMQLSTFPQD